MKPPRAILAVALALGIAADALLRQGFTGIGFPLWIALVAIGALAVARRADIHAPSEARVWLAVAVMSAIGMAWRAAPELQALDFLATLFALGLAAVVMGQPDAGLRAVRLRDSLWAGARVLRDVFIGAVPLVLREALAPATRAAASGRGWPLVRATLIVVALVALFGSLLRAADPVFASFVTLPRLDLGITISHVVITGFFAWVFAGWARGAFVSATWASRAPDRVPISLGMLDVNATLGTLVILFALFVATQVGVLFGGERFLLARTGLTAAGYARQGFFQMVVVAALVVPLLLVTRALLRPDPAVARRHTVLAVPIVLLLLAMIASAALRMRLYVRYFGFTTDRYYTLAIMAWLAVVLMWLALTTLRGREGRFAAGALVTALATLAMLNLVVPDVAVARVNVARADRLAPSGGTPLDVAYLSTLGGDAARTVIEAVLTPQTEATSDSLQRLTVATQRCHAAQHLLARWGPSSRAASKAREAGAWRRWNAGEQRALELSAERALELRTVQHEACTLPRDARAPNR